MGWHTRSSGRYLATVRCSPPHRYRIIDVQALMELLGFENFEQHQHARANWVDAALVALDSSLD